jgi:polysaccharide chain length determinant protein (PEP-CTERM system associated)
MNQTDLSFPAIIDMVIRRRWIILTSLCAAIIVGIYLAFNLPRMYESSTRILVLPQKVPEKYVTSVVSVDIRSRINTLQQQIMSHTNLERIINTFSLYTEPEHQAMYMEQKVADLRGRIGVKLERGTRKYPTASFLISYQGTDPNTAQKVANSLATYMIDENLKLRESQAMGTSTFLEEELTIKRKKLAAMENELKVYREKYMGELPEQLETNLQILDRLEKQYAMKHEEHRDAQQRINLIDRQIADARSYSMSQAFSSGLDTNDESVGQSGDLASLQAELRRLRTKYTPEHPDIIRLQRLIKDLQAEAGITPTEGGSQTNNKGQRPVVSDSIAVKNLKHQRYLLQNDMADLKNDMATIKEQIEEYQRRVENAPRREQELLSLRRDYENMNKSYNSLLQRKLEAELSVGMEKKQKGEQFRIIDPARIPMLPIKPDLRLLFMMVMAVGLGIGCGISFLLEFQKASFRESKDIEAVLGLSVLAMVPPIRKPGEIMRQRINWVLSIVFGFFTVSLVAGYYCLSFLGTDRSLEFARKYMMFLS